MPIDSLLLLLVEGALFAVVALALGDAVLRLAERLLGAERAAPHSGVRIAGALLVGFGAVAYVGVALGLLGVFGRWTLLGVGAAAIVARRSFLLETARLARAQGLPRRPSLATGVAAVIAAPVIVALWLAATAPPTAVDALAYHLPEAKALADTGKLRATLGGDPFYGNLPKLGEVLVAEGLAVDGVELGQTLPLLVLFAFIALVAVLVRRLAGDVAAGLAVIFLLLHGELVWNATVAYVDAMAVSFEVGALLALVAFGAERDRAHVALAGVLIGLALSVKYTAGATAVFVVLLLAALAWHASRDRRATAGLLARFVGVAALVGGFWYAKNAVRFGNPVYPLFFGHSGLDEATYRSVIEPIQSFRSRTLAGFLAIPWDRFALPSTLHIFIAFALLPAAFAVRGARVLAAALVPYIVLYTAYWYFIASHATRFLMPATVAALVLLAATLGAPAPRVVQAGVASAAALAAVIAGVAASPGPLVEQAGAVVRQKLRSDELRYALGVESGEEYLVRRLGCVYSAARYLELRGAEGDVVDNWSYGRDFNIDFHAANRFRPVPALDGRRLGELVALEGFRWIYVRAPIKAAAIADDDPAAQRLVAPRADTERRLLAASTLVWSRDDCALYEIRMRGG